MNVLDDPVLSVRGAEGLENLSLPETYNQLFNDNIESFEALQVHQRQSWHTFLAQLGAIVTESNPIPETAGAWRERFLEHAPHHAWEIQSEDLSQPAFLQPPVPESDDLSDWKLQPVKMRDVPSVSRNHGIKARTMREARDEHYIYTLVNQAQSAFYNGRGNYRTVRINGGYAARPFMSTAPTLRWGPRIANDIRSLRDWEAETVAIDFESEVTPLLWLLPPVQSKSEDQIPAEKLHPLFIDCPRVFRYDGEVLRHHGTKGERISGIENGITGDPWAPIDHTDTKSKALNPKSHHFGYRTLAQILFSGDYTLPKLVDKNGSGYLVFEAVTGEQGGRPQHLKRVIEHPYYEDDPVFGADSPVAKEADARLSRAREVGDVLSKIRMTLFGEDWPYQITERFHDRVDSRFFDRLFEATGDENPELREFWDTFLFSAAEDVYEAAKRHASSGDEKSRWQRIGEAENVFGSLHNILIHKSN